MNETPTKIEYLDASDLGILPGRWPFAITRDGVRYEHLDLCEQRRDADNDVIWTDYRSSDGRTLRVVND